MKTTKTYTENENGFYTNYTEEDTLRSKQELKESGNCPMTNPEFYELWKWEDSENKLEDEKTKSLKREKWLREREALRQHFYGKK
jgi:hypothetical protein